MSQRDWTPIRRVAEMLSAGHRNILTFQWAPELAGGKAKAAIAELVSHGLVVERGFALEPTPAFPGWLADFRLREDQSKPGLLPEPPVDAGPAPDGFTERAHATAQARKRKRYFRRLSKDHHQAGLEIAARIQDVLDRRGGSLRLSAARRAVHGDRHPELWQEGVRRLVVHRIAKVADGKISLRPSEFELPDPYGRPKPRRRRRNRGQSEWFEKNRWKMDDGQHSDFDEDWSDEEDDLAAAEAFWRQLDEKGPEG